MQECQLAETPRECIYYFIYEMKIEFIPHIEEEIEEFLEVCHQKVHTPAYRLQIVGLINKRINDIDRFFHRHWNDYRVQLLMRSRKMLVDFTKQYHQCLATHQPSQIYAQRLIREDFSESKLKRNHDRSSQKEVIESRSKGRQGGQKQSPSTKYAVDRKRGSFAGHRSSDKLQPVASKAFNNTHRISQEKLNSSIGLAKKEPINAQLDSNANAGSVMYKQRISSASTESLKVKVKPNKTVSTVSPPVKKMTKEQYIAYLKNKKTH